MFGAILLGLWLVVLLIMAAGFVVTHIGPISLREQVAEFYYNHIRDAVELPRRHPSHSRHHQTAPRESQYEG